MSDKCRARLDLIEQIKKDNSIKFKVIKGDHKIVFD